GTAFTASQLGTGLAVQDITGDGIPDLINTSFGIGTVEAFQGNGDGTFTPIAGPTTIGQGPATLAMADIASTSPDDFSTKLTPAGHADLIVANSGVNLGLGLVGPPDIAVVPTDYDDTGAFTGFGTPQVLYTGIAPQDVDVADFNGDGIPDIAVTDSDGIHIV